MPVCRPSAFFAPKASFKPWMDVSMAHWFHWIGFCRQPDCPWNGMQCADSFPRIMQWSHHALRSQARKRWLSSSPFGVSFIDVRRLDREEKGVCVFVLPSLLHIYLEHDTPLWKPQLSFFKKISDQGICITSVLKLQCASPATAMGVTHCYIWAQGQESTIPRSMACRPLCVWQGEAWTVCAKFFEILPKVLQNVV